MEKTCIIMPHISPIGFGCDYVAQTASVLASDHFVFTISLHEPITVYTVIHDFFMTSQHHVEHGPYTVLRPIFLLPGNRWHRIYQINLRIYLTCLSFYVRLAYPHQKKLLWVSEPLHAGTYLPIFAGYKIIYDCNDYFPSLGNAWTEGEASLLCRAHHVFTNSQQIKRLLGKQAKNVTVAPPGFASAEFSVSPRNGVTGKETPNNRRVVGYIGSIDFRMDFLLLFSIIRQFPNTLFVFVGPVGTDENGVDVASSVSRLFSFPNVVHSAVIPKRYVPFYISQFDVCIIPFNVGQPFVRYSTPMKFFEYLSMGKPVLTTDIPALRSYKKHIYIGRTAADWKAILHQKNLSAVTTSEARNIVGPLSWVRRVRRLMQEISL